MSHSDAQSKSQPITSEAAIDTCKSRETDQKKKKMKKSKKKTMKKKKMSRKELDYKIYMAQFSAPEKTWEYLKDMTTRPQFKLSIYPPGFRKPLTQFEEMGVPTNFCKRSYANLEKQPSPPPKRAKTCGT